MSKIPNDREKRYISIAKRKRTAFLFGTLVAMLSIVFSAIIAINAAKLYGLHTSIERYTIIVGQGRVSKNEKIRLFNILKNSFRQLENNPLIDKKEIKQIEHKATLDFSKKTISYSFIADINSLVDDGMELSFTLLLLITVLMLILSFILYLFMVYLPGRYLQADIDLTAKRLKRLEIGKQLGKKGIKLKETALLIENSNQIIEKTLNIIHIYQMLSIVNQLIIRVKSEKALFKNICEIFVNQGGFKLAWIGLVNENRQIIDKYYCGDGSYVEYIVDSLNKSLYSGPTSKTLKKSLIFINNNTASDKRMLPYKDKMLKRGYRSSASIPIVKKEKLIGALNIYSDIPNLFAKENFKLLKEIAGDIAFALDKIEDERWQKLTAEIMEKGPSYIVIVDKNLNIVYLNKAAEKIIKEDGQTLIGKSCSILNKRLKNRSLTRKFFENIKKGKTFNDLLIYSIDDSLAYLDTTISYFESQGDYHFLISGKDITDEIGLQNSVNKMLFYDFETELPNRHAFLETAELYIKSVKNKQAAIVIVDPHNFTYINDSLGFKKANRLLKAIGVRLTEILKKSDLVAKALGSRFFVLIKDIDAKYTLPAILKRMQEALKQPFNMNSKIKLSFHIGVAVYPHDAKNTTTLLARAETALLYNKQSESEPYSPSFFTKQLEQDIQKAAHLKESLSNALRQKEFVIYYQPYFDSVSGTLIGAESLLRWENNGKMIMPSEFIPFLEKSSMISEVEGWIIEQVASDIASQQKQGLKTVPISINISPASFDKDELCSRIISAAKKHQIDSSLFTIEITERLFMSNLARAKTTLSELKKAGIRIAIDDFGTGYSSLSYLEQLPVDILKIDISFVRKMMENKRSVDIVRSIIAVAHALFLKTIAEGVESKEQALLLKNEGCDYIQGFLYAKPMPFDQFEKYLKQPVTR